MEHQAPSQDTAKKQEQTPAPIEASSPSLSFLLDSANAAAAQPKPNITHALRMPILQMQRRIGNQATMRLLRSGSLPTHIQRSPLSDELSGVWGEGHAGFFDRLRALSAGERSDADLRTFILSTLSGEEGWLALNLLQYGAEANWPLYERIKFEMKHLPGARGQDGVLQVLREANGSGDGDRQIREYLLTIFDEHTPDRWLALRLLKLGPEENFPLQDQIMNILYREGDSRYIRMILDHGYHVETFERAVYGYLDGGEVIEQDETDRHRGRFVARDNTILIQAGLSGPEAATTLFHELEHTQIDMDFNPGQEELEVRLRVEAFRLRHHMPPEHPSFRNPDGTPNESAMVNELAQHPEYASLRDHPDYEAPPIPEGTTESSGEAEFPPQPIGVRFEGRTPLTGWTLLD